MIYGNELLEKVISSVDIVEQIGQCLPLKRRGINYFACCPFHEEKTPSFCVSPVHQSFKCYGCGVSGDIIDWERDYNHLSFPDAVKKLAGMAGVDLPEDEMVDSEELRTKKTLSSFNQFACDYYHRLLTGDKDALELLCRLGINKESVISFKIGYCPDGASLFPRIKGAADALIMEESRLFKSGKDVLEGCYIFPYYNAAGIVTGFSGIRKNDFSVVNPSKTSLLNHEFVLYRKPPDNNPAKRYDKKKLTYLCWNCMDTVLLDQLGFRAFAVPTSKMSSQQAAAIKATDPRIGIVSLPGINGISIMNTAVYSCRLNGTMTPVVDIKDCTCLTEYLARYGEDSLKKALDDVVNFTVFQIFWSYNAICPSNDAEWNKFKKSVDFLLDNLYTRIEKENVTALLKKMFPQIVWT